MRPNAAKGCSMSLFKMSKTVIPPRVLLVVDEEAQVCRLMRRCLGEYFDEIHTAAEPVSACRILEKKRVTHLLCELHLGGAMSGAELIQFARWEFPSIERAVIFTAGDLLEARARITGPEINAVMSKTGGIDAIVAALFGKAR